MLISQLPAFKPEAGFLKHPGLEPERDLARFASGEQGKARPETKRKLAALPELKQDKPRASHQPREEELWPRRRSWGHHCQPRNVLSRKGKAGREEEA